ncbi:hypothetical protein B0H15DRAFT_805484 [Mycena belliarum]|uniref:Uncharacterized protein n=1 Tax=Mycena belliarum TaxID=1033014 RepID=A0AAD6XNF9_9AGAR|nr:hypothetical protein B0H15DRAFT_805484 [Mycena belliae]
MRQELLEPPSTPPLPGHPTPPSVSPSTGASTSRDAEAHGAEAAEEPDAKMEGRQGNVRCEEGARRTRGHHDAVLRREARVQHLDGRVGRGGRTDSHALDSIAIGAVVPTALTLGALRMDHTSAVVRPLSTFGVDICAPMLVWASGEDNHQVRRELFLVSFFSQNCPRKVNKRTETEREAIQSRLDSRQNQKVGKLWHKEKPIEWQSLQRDCRSSLEGFTNFKDRAALTLAKMIP